MYKLQSELHGTFNRYQEMGYLILNCSTMNGARVYLARFNSYETVYVDDTRYRGQKRYAAEICELKSDSKRDNRSDVILK